MSKKLIVKSGTWLGKINSTNLENAKPIFTLETIDRVYKANTLNEVLNLWRTSKDDSEVLDIDRLG